MLKVSKQVLQGYHICGMRLGSFEAGCWHAVCLEEPLLPRVKGGVPWHAWIVCECCRCSYAAYSLLHTDNLYSQAGASGAEGSFIWGYKHQAASSLEYCLLEATQHISLALHFC